LPWQGYLPEDLQMCLGGGMGKATVVPGLSSFSPIGWRSFGVVGRVWGLSQQAQGSREVQRKLEEAQSEGGREAILEELRGHVKAAARDPHANHVLQRCIELCLPAASQFVVEEVLESGPIGIALHKNGCRVMQSLLKRCSDESVHRLVAALLPEFSKMAQHQYGKFVVLCFLECDQGEQRQCVMERVEEEVRRQPSGALARALASRPEGVGAPPRQH